MTIVVTLGLCAAVACCAIAFAIAMIHLQTVTMDALARLATLKERGVVTTLEYDAKKAELLARL